MKNKLCVSCGKAFQPRPQTPHQSYCSASECQRTRRKRWQREKLVSDQDYRDNQARAQGAWAERNPDYWREYRVAHPDYVARNRGQQRERTANGVAGTIAKMDASTLAAPMPTGVYQVRLVAPGHVAKMDVWTVEIIAHDCQCVPNAKIAKRGRDR